MPRESDITQENINLIADLIKSEGNVPTNRLVREKLGNTGSMSTISKLLEKS